MTDKSLSNLLKKFPESFQCMTLIKPQPEINRFSST